MTHEDKDIADLVSLAALVQAAGPDAEGRVNLSIDSLVAVVARFSESPITAPEGPLVGVSDAGTLFSKLKRLS